MIYILISNGIVQNTIIAEQDFIDQIAKQYDTILSFKEDDTYPSPGQTYDGKQFSQPQPIIEVPIKDEIDLINQELKILDPKFDPSTLIQMQQIVDPIQGVDNAGI